MLQLFTSLATHAIPLPDQSSSLGYSGLSTDTPQTIESAFQELFDNDDTALTTTPAIPSSTLSTPDSSTSPSPISDGDVSAQHYRGGDEWIQYHPNRPAQIIVAVPHIPTPSVHTRTITLSNTPLAASTITVNRTPPPSTITKTQAITRPPVTLTVTKAGPISIITKSAQTVTIIKQPAAVTSTITETRNVVLPPTTITLPAGTITTTATITETTTPDPVTITVTETETAPAPDPTSDPDPPADDPPADDPPEDEPADDEE